MSRTTSGIRRRLLPGNACAYIKHFETIAQPDLNVVLACRVSGRQQRHGHNLDDAEANLRQAVCGRANVVGMVQHVGPGWDPTWLVPAARLALQHDAVIVAESTDRLIRHPAFDTAKWPDAQARDCDLDELADATSGITLATLLPPNATPAEVRAYQRKRGQRRKDAAGGRPTRRPGQTKLRREEMLPQVIELFAAGVPVRAIANALKLPEATVRRWVGGKERHFSRSDDIVKSDLPYDLRVVDQSSGPHL